MPATPFSASLSARLQGTATVPGDKSISHRSLIIASQAIGTTYIEGLLEGEDVLCTAAALRALGVSIERTENGAWVVRGVGVGGLSEPSDVLQMGNSGTSTRLLMGLVATYGFNSFFSGDASLHRRPMQRVMTPLAQMGTKTLSRSGGRLPLVMRGTATPMPIHYDSPIASAQVKSAILLAGLNTAGRTSVSEPVLSRDHTERMLIDFGVEVQTETQGDGRARISLQGHPELWVKDKHLTIPGDPSSAAFLAVAALIVPGSKLLLKNICINPQRIGLYQTLQEMGGKLRWVNERLHGGEPVADLEVEYSALHGVEVPASRAASMIDEYPILAVAAACAKGTTRMLGLAELRVKESDRIATVQAGMVACGVGVEADSESMTIIGTGSAPLGGGQIKTHGDHRIAMSFLILGCAAQEPVTVDDTAAIATSFPTFIPLLQNLGAVLEPSLKTKTPSVKSKPLPIIQPMVIAIDGPAASGKGTLARRLASYLGFAYLDTGRLYRATALRLGNGDPTDIEAAVAAATAITEDDLLNPRLRDEEIGHLASVLSALPEVRAALLEYQRTFAKRPEGAILDGRDIGTVVCPHASVKFFITASLEARAQRRYLELHGMGMDVTLEAVERELVSRDQRDTQRAAAPLVAAKDAIAMDTTDLDANDVFAQVVATVQERVKRAG